MKNIFLILSLIFMACVSNSVSASTPFSVMVRNDGVEIKKCVDDFGKIDYCTVYDRNHADEIIKYPDKYSVAQELVTQNPSNSKTLQNFSESCMNIQYVLGTGMTLFNCVVNAINTIQRY